MKTTCRITALLLALLMAGSVLAACSGDPEDSPAADTSAAETTAPAETTEDPNLRKNAKDNLPADLNFNGAKIGWICQTENTLLFSVNGGGEAKGDVVYDAVYNRTRSVEERLGLTFDVTMKTDDWKVYGTLIESTVKAGDAIWDIIYIRGNSAIQSGRDYLFQTLEDNKYIDLDQPWWWTPAIEEMSIDGKHIRYLMGDLILDNMNNARVIYFNKRILGDIGQDAEKLYQMAVDRKWTIDEMSKMTKAAYVDVNGDGKMDQGDRMGLYVGAVGHVLALTFGQDVRTYSRDADNYVYPDLDTDRALSCVDTIQKLLYETQGTWYVPGQNNTKIGSCFAGGSSLFDISNIVSVFGESYRSMEDEYGILPVPMLDDKQKEYRTLVTNSGNYAAIPVTCKNPDNIGAVLEALCAESYRSVVEPYFEIALKTKYSSDSYSSQCLDIVRSTMYKNFLYEYEITNCGQLVYKMIINNDDTLASTYAAKVVASKEKLQTIYDDFKANLPK